MCFFLIILTKTHTLLFLIWVYSFDFFYFFASECTNILFVILKKQKCYLDRRRTSDHPTNSQRDGQLGVLARNGETSV